MDFHHQLWEQFLTTSPCPGSAKHIHQRWGDIPPPLDGACTNLDEWKSRDRGQVIKISSTQMGLVLDMVGFLNTECANIARCWFNVFDVPLTMLRTPRGCDVWLYTTSHTHHMFRFLTMDDVVTGLEKECEFQYVSDNDNDGLGAYLTLYTHHKMDSLIKLLYNQDVALLFSGKYDLSHSKNANREHNRQLLRPLYEKYLLLKEVGDSNALSLRRKI